MICRDLQPRLELSSVWEGEFRVSHMDALEPRLELSSVREGFTRGSFVGHLLGSRTPFGALLGEGKVVLDASDGRCGTPFGDLLGAGRVREGVFWGRGV